jgi:riboflavin biosynthesis pyrimidine reductase
MSDLRPFETLYDGSGGDELPLPRELSDLYGRLAFPLRSDRPYVIGNFVSTLDGVVALNAPGATGGGEISGFNEHDRMLMGLLRAVADAVVVGAGTLRSVPDHLWTAEHIYPPLAAAYRSLRATLGKPGRPLNVIVTARGEIDPRMRVFRGEVPSLIVTTEEGGLVQGARRLDALGLPTSVRVASVEGDGRLTARAAIAAVREARSAELILVEGGPHLMGDFFAEGCLDELFLTLAPQVAGRDAEVERPGLVAGKSFAPEHSIWGTLAGVKRGGSHLFLRYSFGPSEPPPLPERDAVGANLWEK